VVYFVSLVFGGAVGHPLVWDVCAFWAAFRIIWDAFRRLGPVRRSMSTLAFSRDVMMLLGSIPSMSAAGRMAGCLSVCASPHMVRGWSMNHARVASLLRGSMVAVRCVSMEAGYSHGGALKVMVRFAIAVRLYVVWMDSASYGGEWRVSMSNISVVPHCRCGWVVVCHGSRGRWTFMVSDGMVARVVHRRSGLLVICEMAAVVSGCLKVCATSLRVTCLCVFAKAVMMFAEM
jgi:hypothetical protein